MSMKLQKTIEMSLATLYLFNQVGKSKNKNNMGKIMLLSSILCMLNSTLFAHYAAFTKTLQVKQYVLNVASTAALLERIGELLLISAVFYTNHSVLSKIYGLLRIPTFVYFDSVKNMFDADFVGFLTNLIFGIEFIFGAFFILLNPVWSNKAVKNGKSLMLLYAIYGFSCYIMTLFKLPFTLTPANLETIDALNSIMNTVLYLLMANSLCHTTERQACIIKNPDRIAANEEAKMKALIEFNEKF